LAHQDSPQISPQQEVVFANDGGQEVMKLKVPFIGEYKIYLNIELIISYLLIFSKKIHILFRKKPYMKDKKRGP
jgi:hypothetical protein